MDFQRTLILLSSMYLCQPTREAVENWKKLLSEDIPDLLADSKNALGQIDPNSELKLEDLLWEYTRLFIGPYKLPCPPWESVYTSPQRLMMQEACDEVKSSYNEIGLTVNNPDIMPDHIGIELNFLALLYEKMESNPEKRLSYLAFAKRFLDEHLTRWIFQFTADMEEAADTFFYKTLARVTRNFIMTECVNLGIISHLVEGQ